MHNSSTNNKSQFIYLSVVGVYVTALILRPILATKILSIGGLVFPGALFVFPLSFVCNDILSEVFGFERSRAIVWVGLLCQSIAILAIVLVGTMPSANFWNNQGAYDIILGQSPRVAIASLIGYYFGELTNCLVISKMKYRANGKVGFKQAYRFVASTIAGEFVDSIIFVLLAFLGVYSVEKCISLILTIWILKTLYEIIFLPLSTKIAEKIKEIERVDVIDSPLNTNYGFLRW